MSPTLEVNHEEEYRNAVTTLHATADAVEGAAKALDEAGDDADRDALTASLTEAEEAFTAAEAKANETRDRLELFKRTAEAREIALPDTPEIEAKGDPARAKGAKSELTYRRHGEFSLFRDLYNRDVRSDPAAAERLTRHIEEMQAEGAFDLSSTDAEGGYLIAPLYLQEEFVDRATAGRVIADAIGVRSLPPNTDSINIPKINTGTSVADQADNAAVSETDAAFGTLAADVKTKAGMQDVAQQLVDRSVPGIDEIIYADLVKEYAVRLDTDVINSSTTNNKGLLQVTGINAVTYTDASPTLSELYPKIANGVGLIHEGIFLPGDAIFMAPRRWAWCLAAQDESKRPLITPYAPQNAAGSTSGVVATGLVGDIQGLPVFVDPNIPTNLGAGTNEDRIIIARRDELFVFEDAAGPYLETFRDVGSGSLTVRFRLHNYWAQLHARRPKALTVISGTGLATPTF
jgi:HK97 family phage major capsid protein